MPILCYNPSLSTSHFPKAFPLLNLSSLASAPGSMLKVLVLAFDAGLIGLRPAPGLRVRFMCLKFVPMCAAS